MMAERFPTNFFFILLSIALLAFSFAVPMPMSMSMMEVGTMDSHHPTHSSNQNQNNDHSTMPCCDVIGSPCLVSIFVSPELTTVATFTKNQKIRNSNLAVEFIIVQNTSPPPKI